MEQGNLGKSEASLSNRADVSAAMEAVSHEVNALRQQQTTTQKQKGPSKLGQAGLTVSRGGFSAAPSRTWEGMNVGMDEPTAASPD